MAIKSVLACMLALLLACQLADARREYFAVKEGHDLLLSCPLGNALLSALAKPGRNSSQTTEKKKLVLWTRDQRELLSLDGTDFFELGNFEYH